MTTKYLKAILVKACITIVLQAKEKRETEPDKTYVMLFSTRRKTLRRKILQTPHYCSLRECGDGYLIHYFI